MRHLDIGEKGTQPLSREDTRCVWARRGHSGASRSHARQQRAARVRRFAPATSSSFLSRTRLLADSSCFFPPSLVPSLPSGLGRGDFAMTSGHQFILRCKRAVHLGAGRLHVWASSPLSYLAAPPAHPVEPRARISRCRSALPFGVVNERPQRVSDLAALAQRGTPPCTLSFFSEARP